MGISWSSNRRRSNSNHYPYPQPPSQLIPAYPSSAYPYTAEPYPAYPPPPPIPCPYPSYHPPLPSPLPPVYSSSYYYSGGGFNACNFADPMLGLPNFQPNYDHYNHEWAGVQSPPVVAQPLPPPPVYINHQQAKKVRNDVNVHRDTLKLVTDEQNPDQHLISFVFDALFDGSITIYYFAKEEANCQFVPVYPEAYVPLKIPFKKGIGQKFHQPSGTGIYLDFFKLDVLSKPSPGDVFPLVISAETYSTYLQVDEHFSDPLPYNSPHMQFTQAILWKDREEHFEVKVTRQILWIDGIRYELLELYGIGNSIEGFNDNDSGKECIICMTEPKDTAVLPCRHMCMCSECAKELRLQSNKCPICRQPIEELMEIKINSIDP